jgi:5'-3' exonuclease
MDIPKLAESITIDMNNDIQLTEQQRTNRLYDYIFICFFLGNDFMPHFPSINIRTGGVHKMLNAYKAVIGPDENLTDGKNIIWKNVRKLVEFLASHEEEYFKNEMKKRDREEKIFLPSNTPEEMFKKFDLIPTQERHVEKYINPFKDGWQKRYYKTLFDIDIDDNRKKQISINYLEGLEWTMKYYTSECPNWRWHYKYNYPPLLQDLIHFIPYFDTTFIQHNNKPVSQLLQLCYVLPRPSLKLLPSNLYNQLIKKYDHLYKTDCGFHWAYCKYFWESHVKLPEIDIDELEKFIDSNKFI